MLFNFVSFLLYPTEVKRLKCAMLGAFTVNAGQLGQLGLGSSRHESSQSESTLPCHLGLVIYSLLFSFKDASAILVGMCFIKKNNAQQKFEGTMFGPIRDPIMCRKTYPWSVNLDYITQPV